MSELAFCLENGSFVGAGVNFDERIADTIALAWKCYLQLLENGKDVDTFKMVFVFTVVRSVRCGRRVTGTEKAKDVMSNRAQRRHGFTVDAIDAACTQLAESDPRVALRAAFEIIRNEVEAFRDGSAAAEAAPAAPAAAAAANVVRIVDRPIADDIE